MSVYVSLCCRCFYAPHHIVINDSIYCYRFVVIVVVVVVFGVVVVVVVCWLFSLSKLNVVAISLPSLYLCLSVALSQHSTAQHIHVYINIILDCVAVDSIECVLVYLQIYLCPYDHIKSVHLPACPFNLFEPCVTCFVFNECGMQQSRGKSHVTCQSVALHDQMLYNILKNHFGRIFYRLSFAYF